DDDCSDTEPAGVGVPVLGREERQAGLVQRLPSAVREKRADQQHDRQDCDAAAANRTAEEPVRRSGVGLERPTYLRTLVGGDRLEFLGVDHVAMGSALSAAGELGAAVLGTDRMSGCSGGWSYTLRAFGP